MESLVAAQWSVGAPRTLVMRTVWLVVVVTGVLAGLGVASEQETVDEYSQTRNTSDGLLSQGQNFTAKYFKCRCEGNQVWDGDQCSAAITNVSVILPGDQSVVVSSTDDFAGVTVGEVQCPPDYAKVHLDPTRSSSYQFSLLSNGSLSWQQRGYEHYCLEHTLNVMGRQSWEASVCLPPPPLPRCCPESLYPATKDDLSCPDNPLAPFSPPISIGEDFVKWSKFGNKSNMKCDEFEKSLNVSLHSGESNLLYEAGEVFILWKTAFHMKEKQKDGFCVLPQEDGGYMAKICYSDHEAIHRNFCETSTCVRKCCPEGEVQSMPDCVPAESQEQLWTPSFGDATHSGNVSPPADFITLYGRPQCAMYQSDPEVETDKFYLLTNGSLYSPAHSEMDPPTRYCLDNFLNPDNTVSTMALICFDEGVAEPVCTIAKKTLYPALLVVSSAFLGATLVIYLSLPDLRNKLHGRCLISLASAFFVSYLLMAISYLSNDLADSSFCIALGFFKHLTLLAAFFWLNVMCFDIWRTLRKTRIMDNGQWGLRRFLWYSLYSWGCPLLIATAAVIVEMLPPSYNLVRPEFSNDYCWFLDTMPMWIYFYMWVSLLVVANVVFFGLVVVILVKGQNNRRLRRSREMNRERMWLYVKLFLVMGVTWIAEVVSYQSGRCVEWIFTDIINALQGLTLFLVFILNRSTLRKIREKCCCGGPKAVLSPSTTLSSSVSSSSKRPETQRLSVSSRFSNTSVSIKDGNIESSFPLKTLPEASEEAIDQILESDKEAEALTLINGEAQKKHDE